MSTTTAEAIRDRILTVIEALTPSSLSADKFRRYRNEGGADFVSWCEANPAAAFRRVQVRSSGAVQSPAVSNTDVEEHVASFLVIVAYPQTSRSGRDAALDRDDLIDADAHSIDNAIGMRGTANFRTPYPDAWWSSPGEGAEHVTVERGDGVDFLTMRVDYRYHRAV